MNNVMLRTLLACALTVQLASCGGSGSEPGAMSAPPPQQSNPTQPTAQDLANAQAADLTAVLDLSGHTLTLSWVDNFKGATGYNIEQQSSSGTWNLVETIPGQGGAGQRLSWMRTVTSASAFRVTAQLSGYTVTLLAAGQDFVQVSPPSVMPAMELDQPQPVTDSVAVSMHNAGKVSQIEYFVDSSNFANSGTGPDFTVVLDTTGLTSTSHTLLARLQTGPGSYLEVQRNLAVSRPDLGLNIVVKGTTGIVEILVVATSNVGVQSVSAALDGVSLGTMTVADVATTTGPAFGFEADAGKFGSGEHLLHVTAEDLDGNTASTDISATFNNAPTLTLASPVDGALVNGSMTLSGTFGSDKPGPVKLVISLGNTAALQTSASPFNAIVSLASLPPGNATLTLVATDSTGTTTRLTSGITITSSPGLAFTPLATLGSKGALLSVSASAVLYQTADELVHLHSGSTDTVLDTTGQLASAQWAMSGTDVVATGMLNDGTTHLFHWTGDGVRHDLGNAGAQIRGIRPPWVLEADSQSAQFVNLTTGATTLPTLVAPSFPLQTSDFGDSFRAIVPPTPDFYLSPNGLVLFYLSGGASVARWDQSSGQSPQISSDEPTTGQPNVETDGLRAAWFSHAPGTASAPVLVSFDFGSNSTQTLSTSAEQFQLADGLLAWTEVLLNTDNVALKISDAATTATAATGVQRLFGTAGGRVLYEANDILYGWSAQHGAQVLLEQPPGTAMIGGDTAYFTNGTQQTLYAVPLN